MYNVMLVDDEEEVRLAIEKKINWQELGFNVVATAENGQEALERALDTQPDVVMTDINMPFMNGLEFSKQLKEELPATKFVIFSGYDEFEYAKEAIELSAVEYILKPIDADELHKIFSRIKINLDDELDKRRNVQNLEKYYQESIPFFKEQLLASLIEGNIESNRINDLLTEYGEDIKGKFYAVSVINFSDKNKKLNKDTRRLLSLSLHQLARERFAGTNYHPTNYFGDILVLGSFSKEEEYQEFVQEIDQICKLSLKLLETPTVAGVGEMVTDLTNLSASLKSAREAADYSGIYFENQAVTAKDLEARANNHNLVEKAKEYINEHYSESDLSVDRLCSYLNVSPNYFSTLFRKTTGLTFVTYLTNLRMEQAKKLLDNTDEKAYIIAGMIGIDEPNYFSYVFKKAYGISPSKYRQQRDN